MRTHSTFKRRLVASTAALAAAAMVAAGSIAVAAPASAGDHGPGYGYGDRGDDKRHGYGPGYGDRGDDKRHGYGKGHGKGHGHWKGHRGHGKGHGHHQPRCDFRGVPESKISLQLYSYLDWQEEIGIDGILDELEDIGLRNVEPFGSPGGGSYEDYTAREFRWELKKHGLRAPSSHGSTDEATFETTLDAAKDLRQKYTGSGGFAAPGIGSYEDTLATAETMDRLGKLSRQNGTGKLFGHNHDGEFTTQYEDPETGEMKSAWQILVENTDPRYVTFQLDVYWAVTAGVDVPALLDEYGDRIELLHIKDGVAPYGWGNITDVGEGDIDWEPILEAARGHVKLYVLERDGAPASAEFARDSFEYLTCPTE